MQLGRHKCPVLFNEVCLLNGKIRDELIYLFEEACKNRMLYLIVILTLRKISHFIRLREYNMIYNGNFVKVSFTYILCNKMYCRINYFDHCIYFGRSKQ